MLNAKTSTLYSQIQTIWKNIAISPLQSFLFKTQLFLFYIISLSDYALITLVVRYILDRFYTTKSSNLPNVLLLFSESGGFANLSGKIIIGLIVLRFILGFIIARTYYWFLSSMSAQLSQFILIYTLRKVSSNSILESQSLKRNLAIHASGTIFLGYLGSLGMLLAEFFALVTMVLIVTVFLPGVGLVLFLVISLSFFLYFKFLSRSMMSNARDSQRQLHQMDDLFSNIVAVRRELIITSRIKHFENIFLNMQRVFLRITADGFYLAQLPKIFLDFIFFSLLVFLVILSDSMVRGSDLGSFAVLIVLYLLRTIPSLIKLQGSISSFLKAREQIEILLPDILSVGGFGEKQKFTTRTIPNLKGFRIGPAVLVKDVSYGSSEESTFRIQNLNFVLEEKEFALITGSSGVGKSTMLNLILGLLRPDSGVIQIFGNEPEVVNQNFPGFIGFVPQSPQLLEGRDWIENVALGIPSQKVDFERVKVLLEIFLGIPMTFSNESFLNSKITGLSGGELKRLGIARAMYANPKLLVLDEPLGELDYENQQIIKNLLRGLKNQISIVCVSHDLSIQHLVDKCFKLDSSGLSKLSS